jgi:hypothetical protein
MFELLYTLYQWSESGTAGGAIAELFSVTLIFQRKEPKERDIYII